MDQRAPLVRPPQWAQGGGSGSPFGGSGAPGMPQPGTQRARDLAVQYADDERGRFTERVFTFGTWPLILAGANATETIQVVSNRTSFVRLVAMRGGFKATNEEGFSGLEMQNLQLRLQINGSEDLTTNGQGSLPVEFDGLFSPVAPWFWFAAPPRLRTQDQLQATIFNSFPTASAIQLQPYLLVRLVDDQWWRELYGT